LAAASFAAFSFAYRYHTTGRAVRETGSARAFCKESSKMPPTKKQLYTLALDIGGTKLAGAVFDASCNLVCHSRMPTRADEGPDTVFPRIVHFLESFLKRYKFGPRDLHRIGVGCGGPLDSETGIVYSPPNLPGWDAFPLKERLEKHFGLPVFVDNDANAAALGEHRFGAGQGCANIFYTTISTGIGAGLILDGKIYRGSNCSAGEFGHIVLARGGPRCNCGGRGCLEALASGTAIARRAQREAARAPNSTLGQILAKKRDGLTAKDVAVAARHGDPLSQKIFHDATQPFTLASESLRPSIC
jgi:glucokinase